MKRYLPLPFLLLGLSCVGATVLSFKDYVASYEKTYKNSAERIERQKTYEENLANIKILNSRFPETSFGVNKFSDLSPSEFKSTFLLRNAKLKELLKTRNYVPIQNQPLHSSAPRYVNWFGNATTAVRNQGQCGSCWAFSTVEQVESDWFLSGKSGWSSPQELSVQQLVDCDSREAYGCAGTYAGGGSGYRFIAANGGLTSESKYPYVSGSTGTSGTCKKDMQIVGGKISNFSYATKPCDLPWDDCNDQDEDKVAQYIGTHGPLAICANAHVWQYYKNGVMSGKACGGYDHGSLDHCVQLVGYSGYDAKKGAKASGDNGAYWIVRNSWATNWGQNGFIYLAMGNNTCGIADVPSFAVV